MGKERREVQARYTEETKEQNRDRLCRRLIEKKGGRGRHDQKGWIIGGEE